MTRRRYRVAAAAVAVTTTVPFLASCAADAPAAAPAAAPSADVLRAPWADQPGGSPSIRAVQTRASLGFPAGTTYAEALTQLLASAARDGSIPAGATLMPPLPAEVVYVAPADPTEGLRLSLTAPWGWALDSGAVRPPSYSLPGSLTPAEALRAAQEAQASGDVLPAGAKVDVPDLPACQVAHGSPEARPPCS